MCIKLSFVLRSFPQVVALVGYLRTPLQLAKSVAQISVVPHVVEASKSVTTPSVVRSADPIDAQVTLPTKARFRTHHSSASQRTHTRRTVGCLAAFQLRGSGAVGVPGQPPRPCAMARASQCVRTTAHLEGTVRNGNADQRQVQCSGALPTTESQSATPLSALACRTGTRSVSRRT